MLPMVLCLLVVGVRGFDGLIVASLLARKMKMNWSISGISSGFFDWLGFVTGAFPPAPYGAREIA